METKNLLTIVMIILLGILAVFFIEASKKHTDLHLTFTSSRSS